MSRNATQTRAESAELPDDIEISGIADYELVDPCKPQNPQAGYRYFAAIKTEDNRPDSVEACKAMGYEVCTEETILSKECTLMRIPADLWERRNRARLAAANKAAATRGNSVAGIPQEVSWQSADHGRIAKIGK